MAITLITSAHHCRPRGSRRNQRLLKQQSAQFAVEHARLFGRPAVAVMLDHQLGSGLAEPLFLESLEEAVGNHWAFASGGFRSRLLGWLDHGGWHVVLVLVKGVL